MTTPLSFTVVVRSCSECPFADNQNERDCLHDYQTPKLAHDRWVQNVQRLTNSCPMLIKQKENSK